MKHETVQSIKNDPDFISLVQKRSRFGWLLSAIILVIYFGFVLLIAFEPKLLGTPLADGWATTVGIPLGIGVILIAFALTGIYVRRANREFDSLTRKIKEKAKGVS